MKAFLLSDLVVHELVSMQLDGIWLTSAQFRESARLWISRHAPKNKVSEESTHELEREALQIAERLIKEGQVDAKGSPLKRFFLDIPVVNYAEPMSARALAASLEVCRARLCHCGSCVGGETSPAALATEDFTCHPAARLFFCAIDSVRHREGCKGDCAAGAERSA
jgi:hypothetical protein